LSERKSWRSLPKQQNQVQGNSHTHSWPGSCRSLLGGILMSLAPQFQWNSWKTGLFQRKSCFAWALNGPCSMCSYHEAKLTENIGPTTRGFPRVTGKWVCSASSAKSSMAGYFIPASPFGNARRWVVLLLHLPPFLKISL